MNEKTGITLLRKDDGSPIERSTTVGEKRSTSYYLPIIFLIALIAVILIDVLNG